MEEKAAKKQAAGEGSIRDGVKRPTTDERECPRCAETIKAKAQMCRFCQLDLTDADAGAEGRELLAELGIGEDEDEDEDDRGDLSWKTHKRKQKRKKGRESPSRWDVTMLLCLFAGLIGAHRLYTGHTAVGVIQMFTFGGFGVWALLDFFNILTGQFKDAEGRLVKRP
jgi:hypothetical protein